MEFVVGAMASLLGLDTSRNLSYFAVPAAWVCAHSCHLFAIISAPKSFDNTNPRSFKDNVAKAPGLSEERKLFIARAKAAADNGYETLGLFAAAVIAGNQAGLDARTLNLLSAGYLATRLIYNYIYIYLGSSAKIAPLRSLVWAVSLFFSLGLFISSGLKLKNA